MISELVRPAPGALVFNRVVMGGVKASLHAEVKLELEGALGQLLSLFKERVSD